MTKRDFINNIAQQRLDFKKGHLSEYGVGFLDALSKFENLILGEFDAINPKEDINFITYNGKKYVHKEDFEALINNRTFVEVE